MADSSTESMFKNLAHQPIIMSTLQKMGIPKTPYILSRFRDELDSNVELPLQTFMYHLRAQ